MWVLRVTIALPMVSSMILSNIVVKLSNTVVLSRYALICEAIGASKDVKTLKPG